MHLYLSPTSPYGRLILVGALNAGIRDIALTFVDPWSNPAELEAKNPFSQIPTLVTRDGHMLYDSFIIADYLFDHPVRGGQAAATLAYARILLEQTVKYFSLNRAKPERGEIHPHIARARDAVIRALPRAPQLRADSRDFAQLALGCALSYLKLRLPELAEQYLSADNQRALAAFAQRADIVATAPEALESRPGNINDIFSKIGK